VLKDNVTVALEKGGTPTSGKWINTDPKVMVQWYNNDGDKAIPKSKEDVLLRYRKTHTRVVDNFTCPLIPMSKKQKQG
jgi:hypothetical protein